MKRFGSQPTHKSATGMYVVYQSRSGRSRSILCHPTKVSVRRQFLRFCILKSHSRAHYWWRSTRYTSLYCFDTTKYCNWSLSSRLLAFSMIQTSSYTSQRSYPSSSRHRTNGKSVSSPMQQKVSAPRRLQWFQRLPHSVKDQSQRYPGLSRTWSSFQSVHILQKCVKSN